MVWKAMMTIVKHRLEHAIIIKCLAKMLIMSILLCGFHSAFAAETEGIVRIGTLDLKPYGSSTPAGIKSGIVYDLHQELGTRIGLPFTNEIYPFARILNMLSNGELDLITAQPHAAALKAGDKLIVQNQINVIVATRKSAGIQSIEELKDKRLLYIINTSYPVLEDIPKTIHYVKNYEIMLNMIKNRSRVDGGVFSEPAFYYWMHQHNLTPSDFGPILNISTRDDWIFVRKDLPESIRQRIRLAVESMKQDHYYETVMQKFKQKMSLRQTP